MILLMISMAAFFLMAFAVVFMVLQKIQSDDSVPAEILSRGSFRGALSPHVPVA